MTSYRFRRAVTLFIIAVAMVGCDSLSDHYGQTTGDNSQRSLNGLGTFRRQLLQLPDDPAITTEDIFQLGERIRQRDAIVWTPRKHQGINNEARSWFESWLREGDKTLLYVVPNEGSRRAYLEHVMGKADVEQRMIYRRHLAEQITRQFERAELYNVNDLWFDTATYFDDDIGMRFVTVSPDIDDSASDVRSRQWKILSGTTEHPTVVAVTRSSWQSSRIILVVGGSAVTNYAFASDPDSAVIQSIQDEWQTALAMVDTNDAKPLSIGFASTPKSDLPVRKSASKPPESEGIAVLTTWPLSWVTVHAFVAGLVACLVLLPILGRPRVAPTADPNRFADHIDAVASLMEKTSSEAFAMQRLRQYRQATRRTPEP